MNIAVVGLGYWGPNLVRNFSKIPGVQVKYGCDLSKKNLLKVKKDFPSIICTENFSEVLSDSSVEAIAIATPMSTHFSLVRQALLAGKHVLVEKPMTQTSTEARELISIAKQKKKVLMVGFTFVYSETVRKIKKLIEKNYFGQLYYYDSTRINLGLIQKDSNVIWDLAPHDLSILGYLIQEKPISLQAFGSSFIGKKEVEVAHLFLKYRNKMTAHINISWLSPVKIRTILIGGSKKMIVYNDVEPSEKLRVYDKNVSLPFDKISPFSPAYRSGDILIPHIDQKEALLSELQHFIECIKMNKTPLTNGTTGLDVIELLEATDLSLVSKSEIILS